MAAPANGVLITEAPVHLIQANEDDEKEFLGVCLWAHLQCLLNEISSIRKFMVPTIGGGGPDYCIDPAN